MIILFQNWWRGRKLVGKHSLLLLAAAVLILPLTHLAVTGLLQPVFEAIEQQGVQDQKARVNHALREFETSLQNATLDYAVWDDMYDYAQTRDPALESETLSPVSHVNNAIDYRGIVSANGTVIWSSAVDLGLVKVLPVESEAMKAVLLVPGFSKRAQQERKTITYVRAKRGIYLLTSARITKSDETGAPRGFIVNGILLNKKSLSDALQVDVTLNTVPSKAVAQTINQARDHAISITGKKIITTQIGLYGLENPLLATIDFATPRAISAAGASAILTVSLAVLIAIITLIALLGFGIRQITVRRLQFLEAYVRNFKANGRALPAQMLSGKDEITALSQQFQALAVQLSDAEEELRKQSYLQGKADSSAGMLHNVRNALAPVRVMQEKWLREETLPFRTNLQKALDELASDTIEPARKQSLEAFVISAARAIALSTAGRLSEMEEVKSSVGQIADILSSYDFDTSAQRKGEDIDLLSLIRQQAKTLAARDGASVEFILPDSIPKAEGNRVHLAQVFDNVFVNAQEAMTAAGVEDMRLVIASSCDAETGALILRITDNGDGIDPENIARIFQRGYSTRDHKAGGIGMHWSANVMRAMGGSITLESDGKGKGATAVLTFQRPAELPALAA
jgi:signal transduction histidine kinase